MLESVTKYLLENKDKYPYEVLVAELQKAGHSKNDIDASCAVVYQGAVLPGAASPAGAGQFWNFQSVKAYQGPSEKWKDFLFGFFAPWIKVVLGIFVTSLLSWIFFAVEIFAIFFLFKRRKFISLGLIAHTMLLIFFVISLLIIFGGFLF